MNRKQTGQTKSIHQCVQCGTFWRQWLDGSWSLADSKQRPKKCCDNSPDFIEKLIPPVSRSLSLEETRRLLRAKKPIPIASFAEGIDIFVRRHSRIKP